MGTEQITFQDAYAALLAAYPERCRTLEPCPGFAAWVGAMAAGVARGQLPMEEAQAIAVLDGANVAQDCRMGSIVRAGNPPVPACGNEMFARMDT